MVTGEKIRDFLFRGDLSELDPDVADIIRHETARQAKYLIMIPSESTIPEAVRETLSSTFHNIYAEGYPLESTRKLTEAEILDYNARLPEFRRLSDERYYKGTEYADIIEALARRRAAEVFRCQWLYCRRSVCQRPAAFRRSGQQRGIYRAGRGRRHGDGHESDRRRPPDTWQPGQPEAGDFSISSATASTGNRRHRL